MLAEALLKALSDPDLRTSAAKYNRSLVEKRASSAVTTGRILEFYEKMIA
jgi:hypothetical protein